MVQSATVTESRLHERESSGINKVSALCLLGVYSKQEALCLVMELVRGQTLWQVVSDTATALSWLERVGLLHRDIKTVCGMQGFVRRGDAVANVQVGCGRLAILDAA